MFCRAANGALAPVTIPDLFLETLTGHRNMAFISRISQTYRRRLRSSSHDVLVAVAATLLAGIMLVAALWKPPSPDLRSAGETHSTIEP